MTKYGSFTDASWAPLREAVPSFADEWSAFIAQPGYDPLDASQNAIEFRMHLADMVSVDPEALGPLFAAMERLFPSPSHSHRVRGRGAPVTARVVRAGRIAFRRPGEERPMLIVRNIFSVAA
jgi:hypothetical protein